jgi:phospholipase/carboxylesterase
MLSEAGAEVQHRTLPVGHQLSQADLTLAKAWVQGLRHFSIRRDPEKPVAASG